MLYLLRYARVSGSFRVFDGVDVGLMNLLTLSQVPFGLLIGEPNISWFIFI